MTSSIGARGRAQTAIYAVARLKRDRGQESPGRCRRQPPAPRSAWVRSPAGPARAAAGRTPWPASACAHRRAGRELAFDHFRGVEAQLVLVARARQQHAHRQPGCGVAPRGYAGRGQAGTMARASGTTPQVLGCPAMSILVFTVKGTPCSGPSGWPLATRVHRRRGPRRAARTRGH